MADIDRCPPHNFKAGWAKEDVGVMFCVMCGDVRSLLPQEIEAPAEENSTVATATRYWSDPEPKG